MGSPLYTVNMFYYHWLIKKLLWAYSKDRGEKKVESQEKETDARTPEPYPVGHRLMATQIHRNGLIQDVRVSQKYA